MNSNKKTAIIVGALILIAYGVLSVFFLGSFLIIVMLLELISGAAVVGTAVLMFPILKPHNKNLTLGYVVCKIIEGVIIIVGGIILLSLIIKAGASDSSSTLLLEARHWLGGMISAYIFSIAAYMFYYLLYQSKLIPRFISVWGLIAVTLLLAVNLLGMMGRSPASTIFFALPIILNELFLAIWLIVKGFDDDAIVSEAVKTDMNDN